MLKEFIEELDIEPIKLYEALNYIDIVYISLEKGKKSKNSQTIFGGLNSTGLSLIQTDLIGNYPLMSHSYEKQKYLYEGYWPNIENKVTNNRISDFVRDYLTMKTVKISVKSNVYNGFKDYIKNNSKIV